LRRIFIRQLQILGSTLGDFHEFSALLTLVKRNGLRPIIDAEFPMTQAHDALDRLASGEQFGKIAIAVGSP
jgi:D-arabinose 1-dehydrogenase-like Zn-dependent alcohol dehydrogenase